MKKRSEMTPDEVEVVRLRNREYYLRTKQPSPIVDNRGRRQPPAPSIDGFIDLTAPDGGFVRINPDYIREKHPLPHGGSCVNYAGNAVHVVQSLDEIETLISRSKPLEKTS